MHRRVCIQLLISGQWRGAAQTMNVEMPLSRLNQKGGSIAAAMLRRIGPIPGWESGLSMPLRAVRRWSRSHEMGSRHFASLLRISAGVAAPVAHFISLELLWGPGAVCGFLALVRHPAVVAMLWIE